MTIIDASAHDFGEAPSKKSPKSVEVIVKQMPAAPSKPLFRDPTRLLSVAAFIFSVGTGLYAALSARDQHIAGEIEAVGKLISQFYERADKLRAVDAWNQAEYYNLLRSQQRSDAARALQRALSVKHYVDTGIWASLAMMHMFEWNYLAADNAWNLALERATLLSERTFVLRNIALNDFYLRRISHAEKSLGDSLKSIDGESGKPLVSDDMFADSKAMERFSIHLTWTGLYPATECAKWTVHYDLAAKALDEAFREAPPDNLEAIKAKNAARQKLEIYTPSRQGCT